MGMYVECRDLLVETLKKSGCIKQPLTTRKKLLASAESRVSAVICEEETVERQKGRKVYTDGEGRRLKRSRLYSRDIIFSVVIGDYSSEKIEEIYEKFLRSLPDGIYVDGDYVSIEPRESDWMDEKDHVLYAKVTVQSKIVFHGGLYRDTDMMRIKDINVDVRKEK